MEIKIYKHKKTGNYYRLLAYGIDKTNNIDIVIYCPCDEENTIYTRTNKDFDNKFSLVEIIQDERENIKKD